LTKRPTGAAHDGDTVQISSSRFGHFDVQPLALQFLDKNVGNIQPQDSEVAFRIKM